MSAPSLDRISELVRAHSAGDRAAFDELVPLVYEQLLGLAVRVAGRKDATLQPTALVHEVFLRMARSPGDWVDRSHFLAVAAQAMRQLLADHARRATALKRGGRVLRVTLDAEALAGPRQEVDLVALDEALQELTRLDERQARIVELRYFGGLENKEIARIVGTSLRTVELDLQMARGFLRRRLEDGETE